MAIYTDKADIWQLSVDRRLQGWQIQVTYWNGEDWETKHDTYAICDSVFEACYGALLDSGFDWDDAQRQLDEWEIFMPEDDGE